MSEETTSVTQLQKAWSRGDQEALAELTPRVFPAGPGGTRSMAGGGSIATLGDSSNLSSPLDVEVACQPR